MISCWKIFLWKILKVVSYLRSDEYGGLSTIEDLSRVGNTKAECHYVLIMCARKNVISLIEGFDSVKMLNALWHAVLDAREFLEVAKKAAETAALSTALTDSVNNNDDKKYEVSSKQLAEWRTLWRKNYSYELNRNGVLNLQSLKKLRKLIKKHGIQFTDLKSYHLLSEEKDTERLQLVRHSDSILCQEDSGEVHLASNLKVIGHVRAWLQSYLMISDGENILVNRKYDSRACDEKAGDDVRMISLSCIHYFLEKFAEFQALYTFGPDQLYRFWGKILHEVVEQVIFIKSKLEN